MKINGPWKIKKSQEKYKNPWIKVSEDQVIRPDGKEGIFGIVEMVNGVSVLPLDDNGYVYLTKEFKYAIEKESIEVVSGGVDLGESEIESAKRELKEETGIEAEIWIDLGIINPFTSVIKSSANLYLAKGLTFSESNPEGTENIKIIKLKFEDVLDMVMKSEINHGPSALLILKANEYLIKK